MHAAMMCLLIFLIVFVQLHIQSLLFLIYFSIDLLLIFADLFLSVTHLSLANWAKKIVRLIPSYLVWRFLLIT